MRQHCGHVIEVSTGNNKQALVHRHTNITRGTQRRRGDGSLGIDYSPGNRVLYREHTVVRSSILYNRDDISKASLRYRHDIERAEEFHDRVFAERAVSTDRSRAAMERSALGDPVTSMRSGSSPIDSY